MCLVYANTEIFIFTNANMEPAIILSKEVVKDMEATH
jgi:hypothetical protein